MGNRRQFLGALTKALGGGLLLPLGGRSAVAFVEPEAVAKTPVKMSPLPMTPEGLRLRELRRILHHLNREEHSPERTREWRSLMVEHYRPTCLQIASRTQPTWADCVELAEIIWSGLAKEWEATGRGGYRETGALFVPALDGTREGGADRFTSGAYWCAPAIVALVEAVLALGGGERFDQHTPEGAWSDQVRSRQLKGGRHHD
jgi:hypothetical protein